MTYQFHHIHLLCSDLEEHIRFFTKMLGAVLVARKKFGNADGATLDLNGTTVNLRVAAENEAVDEDTSKPGFGYHHICLQVEDVDAAYNELTQNGFTFDKGPLDVPADKYRIAFFRGPDNITIELLQPI